LVTVGAEARAVPRDEGQRGVGGGRLVMSKDLKLTKDERDTLKMSVDFALKDLERAIEHVWHVTRRLHSFRKALKKDKGGGL
jgi:hypothetical protein